MTNQSQTVLLVGWRGGAIKVARKLKLRVVVVAEKRPKATYDDVVTAYYPADFSEEGTDWAGLARRIASEHKIAAVFPLAERTVFPAAQLRARLGLNGVDISTARRCTDKLIMKEAIRRAGLPCANFMALEAEQKPAEIVEKLALPVVVKTRIGSGGRGTEIFRRIEDLPPTFPAGCLAESFISGTEMSIESLVAEGQPIFTNLTEYFRPGWANIVPAALSAELKAQVLAFNRQAITALGLQQGFTHLEIYLTEDGIFFGELAARPPGGYIMALIERAYGFNPWQVWFEMALGQNPAFEADARRTAGVWLFHPGAGRVSAVEGVTTAQAVPHVEQVSVRVKVGDVIGSRLGVGQEAGHILVNAPSYSEAVTALTTAHNHISVRVDGV